MGTQCGPGIVFHSFPLTHIPSRNPHDNIGSSCNYPNLMVVKTEAEKVKWHKHLICGTAEIWSLDFLTHKAMPFH